MVKDFQKVISQEARRQILEKELDGSTQSEYVDKVIKEVGVK